MFNRASQILNCLLEHPMVTVEPGFALASRTAWGLEGEKDDLAFSVEWHDADGCLWAADFSEESLALAEVDGSTISLTDSEGAKVVFRLYKPAEQVGLQSN
jgi:hypothetical protein